MKKLGILLIASGALVLFTGEIIPIFQGEASFGNVGEDISFVAFGFAIPLIGAFFYLSQKLKEVEVAKKETSKNTRYWRIILWAFMYVLSFASLPLSSLSNLNMVQLGIIDFVGSLVRFILMFNIPFVKLPKYIQAVFAVLSWWSVPATIIGFGFLLTRIRTINQGKTNPKEFTKKLTILVLLAIVLDILIMISLTRPQNFGGFLPIGRPMFFLIAIVLLLYIFKSKRRPKVDLVQFVAFFVLMFLYYKFLVLPGPLALRWPLGYIKMSVSKNNVPSDITIKTDSPASFPPPDKLPLQILPPEELKQTAELDSYYAAYEDPFVVHLRKAFNGYLDGTNDGMDNPDIVIEKNLEQGAVSGLSAFDKDYYKSKFVVLFLGDSLAGGKQMNIIFQDKPDKIFQAWVYKTEGEDGHYDLRGFWEDSEQTKNIDPILQEFNSLIFDKEHSI
ncbi:MAG: hypothetical protein PHQ20_04225 [Candidatus Moranbacteria bacterium]|nr:hypothetical protein [Candidatus Moranbacteria bacterium]